MEWVRITNHNAVFDDRWNFDKSPPGFGIDFAGVLEVKSNRTENGITHCVILQEDRAYIFTVLSLFNWVSPSSGIVV